ncbi:hypothetical protein [Burkholderia aenigmatica]|uniref:Uncharacterized protein n=1 Tax=Burkholderia aenigmatica TaxID=2015348 RepID=A0A228I0G6_9BURK|nr:hypothetical protein [Burkholderia aenigmatica]OXI35886.1 hypothetical protein CFB84_36430 [Burkholderia aenigmatica]
MVKTLAVCGALCLAAAAVEHFHEAVADRPAPDHAFATDAGRVVVRHATFDQPGVAPSSNDGNSERQTAAQVANKPPIVALGVANAGWSALFSH